MSTPNAGGDLKMSTPNAGGDLKISTPNAEPPYREEPRRTNKESPPPPPRLSVAAAADRYSEFFSVLFKEFRDRSIHAPLDMAHYSKARSSLAVAVAEDPKDAGRNISPYWARKVAELVEEAQPYTVPGFIAVQLQNWIDLGDDLTQDLTPEPESEPARFVETSTSDIDECARQIWDEALDMIQLSVTRPNFETWLKRTVGVAYRDGEFVVGAENAFIAESLEQRMYSLIARTLKSVLKAEVEVRFEVVGKVVGPGLS